MAENKGKNKGEGGGGASKGGPKASIAIIPQEVSKKEVKVLAELTNSAGERKVRFIINKIIQGPDAYKSTANGKVEHLFKVPDGTEQAHLRVETLGEPRLSDEIDVVIPLTEEGEKQKKEEKKPLDLELKAEGKDGKWVVNTTIVDGKGNGVKGIIRILTTEGRISPPSKTDEDFPTDEMGTCLIKLEFTERQKEFRFLVLGTAIDKTLRLAGPRKPLFPSCPPPTPEDLGGGFWGPFKAGWRKRKKVEGGEQ